jgi:tetratricopeptide (TPR) repeat protein
MLNPADEDNTTLNGNVKAPDQINTDKHPQMLAQNQPHDTLGVGGAAKPPGDAGNKDTSSPDNLNAALPCAVADALLEGRMFKEAADKYGAILADKTQLREDTLECAKKGLVEATKGLADASCAAADALLEGRMFKEAADKYETILTGKTLLNKDTVECVKKGFANATNALASAQCGPADAMYKANMFEEAIKRYATLLEKNPDLECAKKGLVDATNKVLEARCKKAHDALTDKQPSEALSKFNEIIKDTNAKADEIVCATQGLHDVAKYFVDQGDKLQETDIEGAKAAYEAATKVDADDMDARKKLTRVSWILTEPHVPLWREIRQIEFKDLLQFLKGLPATITTMPIIEVVILLFVIWLLGRKFVWGVPTLSINQFSRDGKDEVKTPVFTSMVGQTLFDLTGAGHIRRSVLMVTGPITPVAVDVVGGLISPIERFQKFSAAIQKILGWLLAKPSLTLSGSVYDADQDCKVTVQLESGDRIVTKHLIGADEFAILPDDPGKCWEQLADCAAIWALFSIHERPVQPLRKLWVNLRDIIGKPLFTLQTLNWQSYTWFFLGNKRYQLGSIDGAETAYLKSINLDPSFAASRVNLASIYHHAKNPRLDEALEQLNAVIPSKYQEKYGYTRPSFYARSFCLLAIYADQRNVPPDHAENPLQLALNQVKVILLQMKKAEKYHPFDRNLKSYLEWRQPVAQCTELGLKIAVEFKSTTTDDIRNYKESLTRLAGSLTLRVDFYSLYNLACTCALFYEYLGRDEDYKNKSLCYLTRSLDITKNIEPKLLKQRTERICRDATFGSIRDDADKVAQEAEPTGPVVTDINPREFSLKQGNSIVLWVDGNNLTSINKVKIVNEISQAAHPEIEATVVATRDNCVVCNVPVDASTSQGKWALEVTDSSSNSTKLGKALEIKP